VWGAALASVALGFARLPAKDLAPPLFPFHVASGAALALVATYAVDLFGLARVPRPFAIARTVALFAIALWIGRWILHADPEPGIDIFPLHQQAAEDLLHGKSIYEPGSIATYTTYAHQHDVIDEYTYLPLGACWTTLAYGLTHDIRWANLAGIVVGGGLLWVAARRCFARVVGEAPARVWADLLAVLLLFHPRGWMVLEMAWTEPMSAPFLAGVVVAVLARRRALALVCLGLLVAGKQHLVLYVPFFMTLPIIGLGGAIVAGLVAAATILPFVAWTPYGFLRGVWLLHKNGPLRGDALNVTGELSPLFILPSWVGFLAGLAPLAALRKLPRKVSPLLLGASMTFVLFYLFGRQAFLNYYWLLDFTALLALATLPDALTDEPTDEPASAA
jgi:hypothetical protein